MAAAKRTDDCVVAVDMGTQSVRASSVDLKGRIVDFVQLPIEPWGSPRPGWTEQDPEYFWKMICTATGKLMSSLSFVREAVRGMAVTPQRTTYVNVDRSGKPLRPAIVWPDQRKAGLEKWPGPFMSALLRGAGWLDTVRHAIRESEINWLRQNQPEIWEKTYKFLLLSGFITYRLTGEFRDSTGCTEGFFPFDYKKQEWACPRDFKWKMFPVERNKLCDLVRQGDVLGYVTESAAVQTGLPAGLPVIAAGGDKACEALGAGCMDPSVGCISCGTTATIVSVTDKYTELIPLLPPYPAAVPGMYNTEYMIYRGYWMISWFKREFGFKEQTLSESMGISPEELLEADASLVPPGSMGLMLQPYWTPGVKFPGPEAKGGIIGFGDVHTKAHIYRALLEGLAYALLEGGRLIERKSGVKMKSLIVAGGGSRSSLSMQIMADVFNLPAARPGTFEASTLGAAIDCAAGLGLYPDFISAVKAMTSKGDEFLPVPENVKIYRDLYERVYLKMYKRLKSLYREIREITGYPENSK